MPGRMLFKEKQLRLYVVAALVSGTPSVADALLLPPNPLASSASWDCRTSQDNDWLCQNQTSSSYSAQRRYPQPAPEPVPEIPGQTAALPVFRPEPEILPEREVPAGMPVSDSTETALLMELLNSPQNHYVLQWLAANDRGSLEKMKRRYPVLQDATIAHYQRSGKDWFVLLDGPYSSRIEAMAALESSPRAQMARELYPWTRSLASIQKLDLVRPQLIEGQMANTDTSNNALPALARTDYSSFPVTRYEPVLNNFQLSQPAPETLAYGQEFDDNRYESYPSVLTGQTDEEMYVSIAPGYRSKLPEPATEIDYNSYQKPEPRYQPAPVARTPEPVSREYYPSEDVLMAPSGNYTIEWMASSRKSTLERAQRRFEEFRDTQILYYRRFNRDRYVLVSKIFGNRRDAVNALSRPSLTRVSSRLSPRVRNIGSLQELVGIQNQQYRQTARVQPVRYQKPEPRYRKPVRRQKQESQPVRGTVLRYAKAPEPEPLQRQATSEAIVNAPDNSYTIQWFAANNIESVEKMKRRFPELAEATTIHFRRNQKDWFVLLQGQFRNSQEAINTIQSPALKQAMLVLHPWTRPVNSLKKLQIVSR